MCARLCCLTSHTLGIFKKPEPYPEGKHWWMNNVQRSEEAVTGGLCVSLCTGKGAMLSDISCVPFTVPSWNSELGMRLHPSWSHSNATSLRANAMPLLVVSNCYQSTWQQRNTWYFVFLWEDGPAWLGFSSRKKYIWQAVRMLLRKKTGFIPGGSFNQMTATHTQTQQPPHTHTHT